MQSSIRQRIPFTLSEDSEDVSVMDDQEQDELIQKLRDNNTKVNQRYILMAQIIILLSTILHLIYFVNPTDDPFLVLLPHESKSSDQPIPLPRPFTLVSVALHINLLLHLDTTSVRSILLRMGIDDNMSLYTLSFTLSYSLALVAPTVCLFLRRSWLTVAWWSITAVATYGTQSVLESILNGNEQIASLEAMKYTAPGA